MNNKILILSGGTGGHVIPAIIFGNFLIEKGYSCSLILDTRGKKYSHGFKGKIYTINASHLSGNFFSKIISLLKLILGFFQSLVIVYKIKPTICISFGSYATLMPLLMILIIKFFMNIQVFIHEQNSVLGKVNLFFLPYSKYIFTNFNSIKNFNSKYDEKKIYVGLPTFSNLDVGINKIIKKKDIKIIFVYGGSQGSIPLIKRILVMLKKIGKKDLSKVKFFFQAPKEIHKELSLSLEKLKVKFIIEEFYHNIEEVLAVTNLAITRAGSGTINDLIRYNIPSIIVPLAHSIYNHQYHNAEYLTDKKASILFDENKFDINIDTNILKELIISNLNLDNMKKNLYKISLPDANKIMLENIL